MRREVPLVNGFYTTLAYERLLVDWVAEAATGEAIARSYQRTEQYAREQGNGYYLGPGALTGAGPAPRMPDFGNALGGGEEMGGVMEGGL